MCARVEERERRAGVYMCVSVNAAPFLKDERAQADRQGREEKGRERQWSKKKEQKRVGKGGRGKRGVQAYNKNQK